MLEIEVRGGLGDLLIKFHHTTAYEELCALGQFDRARVTIISHNPFADELLKWHPNRDRIDVVKSSSFIVEYDKPDLRRAVGVPEIAPPDRPARDPKPVTFYPSPADLAILDFELPPEPYLVIAPTASGMEIENRDIPGPMLEMIAIATLLRGIPIVLVGRTYQGPHAPKNPWPRPCGDRILDLTDRLTVPGTIEVVKRARAGVFAHSALLQLAWVERKPNFVLYPPKYKWHDFDNPSPFAFGKDFPETTRMLFEEFKASKFSAFLSTHFKRGNLP